VEQASLGPDVGAALLPEVDEEANMLLDFLGGE